MPDFHLKQFKILFDSSFFKQTYRFLIVGTLSTVFGYIVNISLISFIPKPGFTSAISYISGLFIGFPLNKYWSFNEKDKSKTKNESFKYLLLYFITFLLNSLFAYYSYEIFNSLQNLFIQHYMNYIYFIPVIFIITIINFLGCKFFVFKKNTKEE